MSGMAFPCERTDMCFHKTASIRRTAVANGADDLLVLVIAGGNARRKRRRSKSGGNVEVRPVPKALREAGNQVRAGHLVDSAVKVLIQAPIGITTFNDGKFSLLVELKHHRIDADKLPEDRRRRLLRRDFGRHSLDGRKCTEKVFDGVWIWNADSASGLGCYFDEPFRGQSSQGHHHRLSAGIQYADDIVEIEPFPRFQATIKNAFLNICVGRLGEMASLRGRLIVPSIFSATRSPRSFGFCHIASRVFVELRSTSTFFTHFPSRILDGGA